MKSDNSKTIHQWLALNGMLKTAKIVAIAQGLAILILAIVTANLYFQNPLVVLVDGENKSFVETSRHSIEMTPSDVETFIQNFISIRYSWDKFEPHEVLERTRPYVKEGFYEKLAEKLQKDDAKKLKGKQIRQIATDIKVKVTDDSVVASFLKILVIEGVPLPIQSEIAFQLAKGVSSKANPFGIYINGILEHNDEKQ